MVLDKVSLMAAESVFELGFDDFDRNLLPAPMPKVGSPEFCRGVSRFFVEQFQALGCRARVVTDDRKRRIRVAWTKPASGQDPLDKVGELLQAGRFTEAVPILATLHFNDPDDAVILYQLGVCHSALGQFDQAVLHLEKLLAANPKNHHAMVGLGIAETSRGNLLIGEEWLRRAIGLDSTNKWAWRNLAGTLGKQRRFEEALVAIRECLVRAPGDISLMIAEGECLEELGRSEEAMAHYRLAIKTGGPAELVEMAKGRLTSIAQSTLRKTGEVREDVVGFMVAALRSFQAMKPEQIQELALEIALIGSQGLDINDPKKRYRLAGLRGRFSGLQLLSIMHAAFEQVSPGMKVGIDLANEYREALSRV